MELVYKPRKWINEESRGKVIQIMFLPHCLPKTIAELKKAVEEEFKSNQEDLVIRLGKFFGIEVGYPKQNDEMGDCIGQSHDCEEKIEKGFSFVFEGKTVKWYEFLEFIRTYFGGKVVEFLNIKSLKLRTSLVICLNNDAL